MRESRVAWWLGGFGLLDPSSRVLNLPFCRMCTRIQLSNQHISLERCHPPLFVLLLFFSFVPLHPAQHGNDILSAISDTADFSMMAETQLSEFTSRSKSAVCPSIASLVSSYPILTALAFYLSILDR